MRRPLVISLVAAVFVALLAAGGIAVAGAASVPPVKSVAITGSACPGQKEFCFKSAALIVPRNTNVVWKNLSDAPHTVTRCSLALCGVSGGTGKDVNFRSPTANPGHTYAFTFHKPGTYRYFCKIHGYPDMHATITVR